MKTDWLLLRRSDQAVVAALSLAALVGLVAWWWSGGGPQGRLVDHDRLGDREAAFVVNINTADAVELQQLPGVGATLAERIITHRHDHGPFMSFHDLGQVKGIGKKTLELLQPHVVFDAALR